VASARAEYPQRSSQSGAGFQVVIDLDMQGDGEGLRVGVLKARPPAGIAPKLSDAELVTMAAMQAR